jgi:hypothetical protein
MTLTAAIRFLTGAALMPLAQQRRLASIAVSTGTLRCEPGRDSLRHGIVLNDPLARPPSISLVHLLLAPILQISRQDDGRRDRQRRQSDDHRPHHRCSPLSLPLLARFDDWFSYNA